MDRLGLQTPRFSEGIETCHNGKRQKISEANYLQTPRFSEGIETTATRPALSGL